VLANCVVLNTILGNAEEAAGFRERLRGVMPGHVLLGGLGERRAAFEGARGRWRPRFDVEV